jgi:hypothetical protein
VCLTLLLLFVPFVLQVEQQGDPMTITITGPKGTADLCKQEIIALINDPNPPFGGPGEDSWLVRFYGGQVPWLREGSGACCTLQCFVSAGRLRSATIIA